MHACDLPLQQAIHIGVGGEIVANSIDCEVWFLLRATQCSIVASIEREAICPLGQCLRGMWPQELAPHQNFKRGGSGEFVSFDD